MQGETFQIFNCLTFGAEDADACEFERADDIKLGLNTLVFQDEVEDLVIFKSKLQNAASLFCTERLKQVVESYELTGILFDTNLIEEFAE